MHQFCDRRGVHLDPEGVQKRVVIHLVSIADLRKWRATQQPLMIHWHNKVAAFLQLGNPVKADCIQALEDIAILAMLRSATLLRNKTLNFFEACDDAFFAWCAAELLLDLDLDAKLGKQGIIFVGEPLSHWQPPASCARDRPRLRPSSSPTDQGM